MVDEPAPETPTVPLTWDDPPPPAVPLTIEDKPNATGIPDPVASERALKAHQGWGQKSPGYDTLKSGISGGQEEDLRQRAAVEKGLELRQTKMQMIQNLATYKAKTGEALTPDEQDFVMNMPADVAANPKTIFETEYGKAFVSQQATAKPIVENPVVKGMQTNPDATAVELDIASDAVTRREQALTYMQDIENRDSAQSYLKQAWDMAKTMVPGLSWLHMSQQLKDANVTTELIPGQSLTQKVQYLYLLPPEKFLPTLTAAVEDLYKKNPLDAATFVRAVVSYSTSDEHTTNLFGAADAANIVGIGASIGKGIAGGIVRKTVAATMDKDITAVQQAMKGVVKGAGTGERLDPVASATKSGNIDQAAIMDAADKTRKIMAGIDPFEDRFELQKTIPSFFNPSSFVANPGALSREASQRLLTELTGNPQVLLKLLSGTNMVQRAPTEALGQAINLAKGKLVEKYNHISDHFLDVDRRFGEYYSPATNVTSTSLRLGKKAEEPIAEAVPGYAYEGANRPGTVTEHIPGEGKTPNVQSVAREGYSYEGAAEAPKKGYNYEGVADRGEEGANKPLPHRTDKGYDYEGAAEVPTRTKGYVYEGVEEPPEVGTRLVASVGKLDATLFDNAKQAQTYASKILKLTKGSYVIKPEGVGHVIEIPLNANELGLQGAIITTENTTPEAGVFNTFFGGIRTSDDVTSHFNTVNRKIAATASNEMRRVVLLAARDFGKLSKRDRNDVMRLAEVNRDMPRPGEPGERGYFHKTAGEMQSAFQALHGYLPSEQQQLAYFKYVQLSDYDYLLRNLQAYSQKARQGREIFQFGTHVDGSKVKVPEFEGVSVKGLPTLKEDYNVLVVDTKNKTHTLWNTSDRDFPEKTVVGSIVKEGKQVIQVASPTMLPLSDALKTKDVIHFVVTDNHTSSRLPWKQLDYNPGGHSIYPQQWFTKQARVARGLLGRLTYYGDNSIFNHASEAQAKEFSTAMEHGRQLMNSGQEDALTEHLSNSLPYNTDEFKKLFREDFLNKDTPISYAYTGRSVLDTQIGKSSIRRMIEDEHGLRPDEKLRDVVRSSLNLDQGLDTAFFADRDAILPSVRKGLSEGKPNFYLDNGKQMDPLGAMNRGLGQAIRARYMNDYKANAMNSYIEEFGGKGLLNADMNQMRANPQWFFYNAAFKPGADAATKAQANLVKQNIINFIGTPTELSEKVSWVENKVMDAVYNRFGDGKALAFTEAHLLPTIRDPFQYAKAVAFHSKLGLFNPIQLFVQAQSLTHVLGVAGPRNALPSFAAALLTRRLAWTEDEAIINSFADKAGKLGYDRGHFIEMQQRLRESGFGNVMNETAWRGDNWDPKLFASTMGKVLDSGTWFFAEGERSVRLAAYATAFREFKLAQPAAKWTQDTAASVLNRADLLSLNMTRASMAGWQKGFTGMATQFLTFNARFTEQMLPSLVGKGRLTPSEAWSAFATYGAMYGIPATLGGVSFVWPAYESIRAEALNRGIDWNDNYWSKALGEGIASTALSAATGENFNWGQRMGPGANTLFRDAVNGKKTAVDIFLGAGGSVLGDIFKSANPLWHAATSWAMDGGEQFPTTVDDYTDAMKPFAVASNAMKAWSAANYGKYYSRNNQLISDKMTGLDAFMMGAIGVTPQDVTDTNIMQDWAKTREDGNKQLQSLYETNFRRAMQASQDGDPDSMKVYLAKAQVYKRAGDFNQLEQERMFKQAIRGWESTVEKTRYEWWFRGPASKQEDRRQMIINKGNE